MIFYGPPGTGKTTLARIIANTTRAYFIAINAVLAGVADIRAAIATAQDRRGQFGQRTILFVDEVHRFNKAQQDALLPWVENGTVILIGATTENPYFEVNKALVSRSRIFQLKPLTEEDLFAVARQALADPERGYGKLNVAIDDDALAHLVDVANGDARGVLNALELAVETTPPEPASHATEYGIRTTQDTSRLTPHVSDPYHPRHRRRVHPAPRRALRQGRRCPLRHHQRVHQEPARLRPRCGALLDGAHGLAGEEPRFIFRRMIVFAGEDVGLADPDALRVVMACAQAFEYVGMPEGRFHLANAALNFLYGFLPYRAWRALSDGDPLPRTAAQWLAFTAVVAVSAGACALVVGWGLNVLGFVPFALLANVVFFNNFVMAMVLAPLLLRAVYPRVKAAGLRIDDLVLPAPRARGVRRLGLALVVLGVVGGFIAGNAISTGQVEIAALASVPPGPRAAQVGVGVAPFLLLVLFGLLLL